MNIDDFLKPKKVRCITGDNRKDLTNGKIYDVIGAAYGRLKIHSDNGGNSWYDMDCFELVIESAENPLENMKLKPEFEAVEPTFKAGDPVYFPRLSNKLCVIGEGQEDDYVDEVNGSKALAEMQSDLDFVYSQRIKSWVWNKIDAACPLIHATPENHALLSQLYPHIKFEQPPKPLSGDELVRAMLTKGIKNVLCLWGSGDKIIIDRLDYKGSLMSTNCHIVGGLTPIDWYTGEPLTEAVLDE